MLDAGLRPCWTSPDADKPWQLLLTDPVDHQACRQEHDRKGAHNVRRGILAIIVLRRIMGTIVRHFSPLVFLELSLRSD